MATATVPESGSTHFAIPQRHTPNRAKDLRTRVRQALQHGERRLVMDCGEWQELDLLTLTSLIQCASACRAHGASFEITNLSSDIRDGVRALHLHDRIGLAD